VNPFATIVDDLRPLAEEAAANLIGDFGDARVRLAQVLQDIAVVEILAASGQDVETARIALNASILNIPREKHGHAVVEGRNLAFRAVVKFALRLAGAAG
jgi:hypothetical protein